MVVALITLLKSAARVRQTTRLIALGMEEVFTQLGLRPVIDSVFTWDEAEKAFAYLERQKHVGKVVIKVA